MVSDKLVISGTHLLQRLRHGLILSVGEALHLMPAAFRSAPDPHCHQQNHYQEKGHNQQYQPVISPEPVTGRFNLKHVILFLQFKNLVVHQSGVHRIYRFVETLVIVERRSVIAHSLRYARHVEGKAGPSPQVTGQRVNRRITLCFVKPAHFSKNQSLQFKHIVVAFGRRYSEVVNSFVDTVECLLKAVLRIIRENNALVNIIIIPFQLTDFRCQPFGFIQNPSSLIIFLQIYHRRCHTFHSPNHATSVFAEFTILQRLPKFSQTLGIWNSKPNYSAPTYIDIIMQSIVINVFSQIISFSHCLQA